METMKAACWYAAKDIRVEDTEVPSPKENQVKIAVKFTGISIFNGQFIV